MREYATQMEAAKRGIVTPEMKTVAEKEFTDPEIIRERVAVGQIAIPANINHKSLCAEGIGKGLRTKINVNLGISGDANNYDAEMDKVRMALRFGAEAIMGLFRKGDLEVIGIGTWAMRFQCLTLPFQAWIIMSNMLTKSIGYGFRASIVAAGRQGIFLIPALLTLPRFLGILGLQLCQPIADVCTSVMAAVIVVSILKELKVWNEEIQNLSKKTMDE